MYHVNKEMDFQKVGDNFHPLIPSPLGRGLGVRG